MRKYYAMVLGVLQFLKDNNYSSSTIETHRHAYDAFGKWLLIHDVTFSDEAVNRWLEENKSIWSDRIISSNRRALNKLQDYFRSQTISPSNLGWQISTHDRLSKALREDLDSFAAELLAEGLSAREVKAYCYANARFLMYIQQHGYETIEQLDYDVLLKFSVDDTHETATAKRKFNAKIRRFLAYEANKGKCSIGHAFILNHLLIPKVVLEDDFLSNDVPKGKAELLWPKIEQFGKKLGDIGYSKNTIRISRHFLILLFLFFDMFDLAYSEMTALQWFDHVKHQFNSSWISMNRILNQFFLFYKSGDICLSQTAFPRAEQMIDTIPQWCRPSVDEFLKLLEREGREASTVMMYRSSICRFCSFLGQTNINSFAEITAEDIINFNLQDIHSTPDGKAAYNSRIRNFLLHLTDQKIITNKYLYRAVPIISAPRRRIAEILTDNEIRQIWSVDIDKLDPLSLRDYCMVSIGLGMGLRSSDIANLKFTDINWQKQSISFTQQKTGKAQIMPMPVRVGNAIFKYLCEGRPKGNYSTYIFINHRKPFGRLTRGVLERALHRFIDNSDHLHGFHILRKTFSTLMLRGNNEISVISDALGHKTDNTLSEYLSIDEERIRLCPLSLEMLGIPLKEGVFR